MTNKKIIIKQILKDKIDYGIASWRTKTDESNSEGLKQPKTGPRRKIISGQHEQGGRGHEIQLS